MMMEELRPLFCRGVMAFKAERGDGTKRRERRDCLCGAASVTAPRLRNNNNNAAAACRLTVVLLSIGLTHPCQGALPGYNPVNLAGSPGPVRRKAESHLPGLSVIPDTAQSAILHPKKSMAKRAKKGDLTQRKVGTHTFWAFYEPNNFFTNDIEYFATFRDDLASFPPHGTAVTYLVPNQHEKYNPQEEEQMKRTMDLHETSRSLLDIDVDRTEHGEETVLLGACCRGKATLYLQTAGRTNLGLTSNKKLLLKEVIFNQGDNYTEYHFRTQDASGTKETDLRRHHHVIFWSSAEAQELDNIPNPKSRKKFPNTKALRQRHRGNLALGLTLKCEKGWKRSIQVDLFSREQLESGMKRSDYPLYPDFEVMGLRKKFNFKHIDKELYDSSQFGCK